MYRVTLRPIGTGNTRPIIYQFTSLWYYFKILRHLHTALKATYGKNSLRKHEFDQNTIVAHNQEFGDICQIKLDKIEPEEFPDKAVPNV